jgi:ADP-heptose:LPS heptosyltransferase
MSSLISHDQLVNARRLLYMTHLAIGDFIYQGVWLNALKEKYPHLAIDIWFDDCRRKPHSWAAGRNKTLGEWLETDGSFDTIYPIVSDLAERKAQIAAASSKGYDLIVFVGKNRSEQFAKIARQISSSAFVVATKSKPLNNPFAKWWYFHRLDGQLSFDEYARKYGRITDIYAGVFGKIFGLTADDAGGRESLAMKYDSEYGIKARAFLKSFGTDSDQRSFVFLNHLSTASRKDYPWDQLREVIVTLDGRFDNLAFIVNSPPDKFDETDFMIESDETLSALPIKAFTATDSFFELPAVMAECDITISVDTATTHLAAALDKPQVAMMADDVKLWQPPGDGLILEGSGKASTITPAQVVAAFSELYKK